MTRAAPVPTRHGGLRGRARSDSGRQRVKAWCSGGRLYAIDPHEGVLTKSDGTQFRVEPTLDGFTRTVAEAGIEDVVEPIVARSRDILWKRPIAFLYIEGLHDSSSVREDFIHFEPWLASGAYVAFHDYGRRAPAVKAFVDELVDTGRLAWLGRAETLALLRKLDAGHEAHSPRE